MYKDGQIINKQEHIAFANWNNANGGKFRSESLGNGTYKIVEIIVPEPTIEEKNEAIRQTRASLYAQLIDPLHAQKQRKVVLGEWTDELESEYVAQVKALTKQIQDETPYVVADKEEPETAEQIKETVDTDAKLREMVLI